MKSVPPKPERGVPAAAVEEDLDVLEDSVLARPSSPAKQAFGVLGRRSPRELGPIGVQFPAAPHMPRDETSLRERSALREERRLRRPLAHARRAPAEPAPRSASRARRHRRHHPGPGRAHYARSRRTRRRSRARRRKRKRAVTVDFAANVLRIASRSRAPVSRTGRTPSRCSASTSRRRSASAGSTQSRVESPRIRLCTAVVRGEHSGEGKS